MKEKIKLFCIPYAGGSASVYKKWNLSLADNIELCPIELAGRGSRITEKYYENLEEAVDDIFSQIVNDITTLDYAFFGHSMGAFLVYEVAQKINALGLPMPKNIFFSGKKPPGTLQSTKRLSKMSSLEFEKNILALGRTPPELFQYPELKKLFIPLLRSDFSLSETVVDRPEIIPFDTDITVLLGDSEGVSPTVAVQWYAHTNKKCSIHFIEGGHFFIIDTPKVVINIINSTLIQQEKKAFV